MHAHYDNGLRIHINRPTLTLGANSPPFRVTKHGPHPHAGAVFARQRKEPKPPQASLSFRYRFVTTPLHIRALCRNQKHSKCAPGASSMRQTTLLALNGATTFKHVRLDRTPYQLAFPHPAGRPSFYHCYFEVHFIKWSHE